MNDDYLMKPLGELGVLDRGRSRHRPRYAPHLYGGRYPFIQTGDIKSSGGMVTAFTQTYSDAGLAQSRLWEAGTLCITIAANIAETAILTFPSCFPDSVVGFIGNPSLVDTRYVEYTFRHLRSQIQGDASGSVQDNINLEYLRSHQIPVYSLATQKAIAQILGTLDDKIELNRKTNETLEAMAKVLFKSWFVDFDPVRAKAEGRPTGLPADISDLFPDSFEDSELGEIPCGWAIRTIENIAEVIDCLHSKKPDQQEVGKQLLQLNNIEGNGLLNQSPKYLISGDDYAKWSSRIEVEQGDCVITNVGRVGAVAQIPKGVKAAMGRNMTAIRTKSMSPHPTFLLEYLLSAFGREEIRLNIDEGTILNALNVKNIPRLRFFGSPDSILNAYEKSARPLREAMECSLKENQSLSALRDALLPKLISGEIRIPDAEKMLEEVGI